MLWIVSHIKEHITTTEFWRAMSFVLKRIESIAKYLTQLPLPFTVILYSLHLLRAGLRIVNYVKKTKNRNLGETCKFLFAVFKVTIALIAITLLNTGLVSLPSVLLSAFFSYTIFKLIHSTVVLLSSTIIYLNRHKQCVEQEWRAAYYRNNINKHAGLLSMGLLFVCLTYLSTRNDLIWSSPVLLLLDGMIVLGLITAMVYLNYQIIKNKQIHRENLILKPEQIAKIKKFLICFGLGIIALLLVITTPSLGVFSITAALILVCAQDILLTIYYYFYDAVIPDPKPANLNEAQLNQDFWKTNRDYYQNFSPIYYLKNHVSEKFPSIADINKENKKFLLKITFIKLFQLENKIEKRGCFFLSQKKHQIKKKYLLYELAWALNTDDQDALIDLFIRSISDLVETKQFKNLCHKLDELLELFDKNNQTYRISHDQNILGQLFFLAKQMKTNQVSEITKPKLFYQSFWKKMGACDALSQAFKASRAIEAQISSCAPS